MSIFHIGNLKKTFYYWKRNGIKNTWYAFLEQITVSRESKYCFQPISTEMQKTQQQEANRFSVCFSIVVPTYRTKTEYLRLMIDSVLHQTYPGWELILADATEDASVEDIVLEYQQREKRIKYLPLKNNGGISENTNEALKAAGGDYVGLLDHDDVLTPDALFEMAQAIAKAQEQGKEIGLLYSDEDKCNGDGSLYFEPHLKEDFNFDLLLNNNYFCHFMVLERRMAQALRFRKEFDGAQDYDLALRGTAFLMKKGSLIHHIPKVLYHWRCHEDSTASNPQSKQYAYEAGKRALQDFLDNQGISARVEHRKHLGFYQLVYHKSPLLCRSDLGAVGGRLLCKKRVLSGRLSDTGKVFYLGLPIGFSGYVHRAVLQQDAYAVDIRCIQVRAECIPIFEQVVGVSYLENPHKGIFDVNLLPKDMDYIQVSVALGEAIQKAGYRIMWEPKLTEVIS